MAHVVVSNISRMHNYMYNVVVCLHSMRREKKAFSKHEEIIVLNLIVTFGIIS